MLATPIHRFSDDALATLLGLLVDAIDDPDPSTALYGDGLTAASVVEAVKKTGRKQLIIAGHWTEICVAMPAIHALEDGYDVFVVTDASGGASLEAHDMAVRRMTVAGATPVTWAVVASEWQRDWAREKTVPALAEIVMAHGGASGVAFAWEMQLLGAKR